MIGSVRREFVEGHHAGDNFVEERRFSAALLAPDMTPFRAGRNPGPKGRVTLPPPTRP